MLFGLASERLPPADLVASPETLRFLLAVTPIIRSQHFVVDE